MARPLRVELGGGLYHVTFRGDRREDIFHDGEDLGDWLAVFGAVCERLNWHCHAYCEMTNHYHAVVETPDGERGIRFCIHASLIYAWTYRATTLQADRGKR